MSQPTETLISNCRNASERVVPRDTPFILNEWYVAAFSNEVGREFLARTLLRKRAVMFCTQTGEPVAMDGALEETLGQENEDHYEISVASDAPAVAMLIHLKQRATQEQH